uniref:Uncharacterized protein n=1 Tax=Equus asinus TaxID=9793 RepID=A0A9L0IC82_EQUAS
GSPSPPHSSGGLRWKLWRSGDSQYVRGSSWGKHSQQLRAFLLLLLGAWWSRGLLLLGGHVGHKVHHPIAVAKFIVIPGNELDKVVVEGNASPSIEGGRVGVTVKIAGDNLVLSVAQDALEGALRCLLGSTSRSRDDVLGSPSAIAPQLPRGAIHSLLGGSDGMHYGHESLHDAKVVMDDLGRGAKQLVVQEALLTIFRELPYFSWFTPITNIGASAERAEMMTLLAPPFK